MQIISVTAKELSSPRSFFIDCPVDVEMFGQECRRIEIPRELAKYIDRLQRENNSLKTALKEHGVRFEP